MEPTAPPSAASPASPFRRLADFRREHPRGWTYSMTLVMAGLSLIIGLGFTIYDGVMNDLPRAQAMFIALGMVAFYLPGLLMAAAAFGLRRGWTTWVRAGAAAALVQGVMAIVPTIGQFPAVARAVTALVPAYADFPVLSVMSFSPAMLVQGLLWIAADFYVAYRLWRALPWVAADAATRRGFDLSVPTADTA